MSAPPTLGLRASAILLVLGAAACAPAVKYVTPSLTVSGVDFTPYTKQGFLFTPEVYDGPYDAIGLISITQYAGARYVETSAESTSGWRYDPIPFPALMDTVYARATAMGANAIMRFHIENTVAPATLDHPLLPGITVTGFAIRRHLPNTTP